MRRKAQGKGGEKDRTCDGDSTWFTGTAVDAGEGDCTVALIADYWRGEGGPMGVASRG